MNIGWIHLPKNNNFNIGGGNAYRRYLLSALNELYDIEPMGVVFDQKHKISSGLSNIYNLINLKGTKDIWIREYLSTLTIPLDRTKGKNILVFHHIDSDFLSYPHLSKLLDILFYHNLKYINELVVVSKYWEKHFQSLGYKPKLIYNCFDFNDFKFTKDEVVDFKKRYGLSDKPIVYLGNCQKSKGVVEAYDALKDLDVYLVTSGKQRVQIPAINLDLNYRDYLYLLKASSAVVVMSKMKEGWCRTAHEAMLCKTPVVGSGKGGMAELLEGGKQVICQDFNELESKVVYLIKNPNVGKDGFKYASHDKFSLNMFLKEWFELMKNL